MISYLKKIILLGTAVIFLNACAAAVIGGAAAGATYISIKGWLVRDYGASIDKAYEVSLKVVKEHNLEIIESGFQLTKANITAKGDLHHVWIRLERQSKKVTKISVRVGLMGDKEASKMIHESIASLL